MAGSGSAAKISGPKKARIEIIPLIDVVFFLLATFVLFTLSLNRIQSVTANLPAAVPPPPKPDLDLPAIIQITDGDSVYFNHELITMGEVLPRILQYEQSTSTPKILVSGDDRAKFGSMIQVLDKVRESGIQQVSVETAYRGTGR